ncbi:hypothetical protein AB0I94_41565 [Streptomyces sp. NPDC050147]|uniref:hypothetical protein n=1 Tax=Streptomyces sp. NPDC050147 TaxID=3155513 RepID=UPI00344880A1
MSNPQNQHSPRLGRRLGLIAVGAATVCTVTACYPYTDESSKDATSSATQAPKKLRLGQPSPEQEISSFKKTAQFVFTPTKVVEGKPEDLDELDEPDKYAGQKVVWVYVNARHVGGDALKEPPMVMSDVNVETAAGPGTKFILLGALSSTPKDCNLLNGVKEIGGEDVWKKGEERKVCDPYLVPEGTTVNKVTYSQGYYKEPLKWSVK